MTEADSRTHSESGFDFGFKIELDQARKTFNRDEGFQDFGFGQMKSRQKQSQQDVSSNSKHSSKIRPNQPLRLDLSQDRKTHERLKSLGQTQPYQNTFQLTKQLQKAKIPPRSVPSPSSHYTPQQQFLSPSQQLNKQIESYISNGRALQYQSSKLKDKQIQLMRAQQTVTKQITTSSSQILQLNNKMSQTIACQQSIQRILHTTKGQKQTLIKELHLINQQLFEPTNDQQRKLLEQLEAIQQQFNRVSEDHNKLQLSLKNQTHFSVLQSEIKQNVIPNNIASFGGDWNKILYNIKMSCLKPRWILFENQDIQLGVVYDSPSYELVACNIHIGNKTNKLIETVQIKTLQTQQQLLNGKDIKGNNFIDTQKLVDMPTFFYINTVYKAFGKEQISQKLALPFGWIKFGDFQIISVQGFSKLWRQRDGQISSQKRPVDTQIVSQLLDYKKYFPNLIEMSSNDRQLVGVFKVQRGQFRGTRLLCKFKYEFENFEVIIGKTKNTEQVRDHFLKHFTFLFGI